MNRRIYILIITVLLLSACTKRTFDTETALWDYLRDEENGYVQTKSVNGVDFTLTYRPTDLLVKQEMTDGMSEKQIDSLRAKYQRFMYFNLSMSKNNQEVLNSMAGNRNQFGAMVNQLAFGMADKVHLYTQKRDTIPMADYVYPRMYGMSRSTSMLFVYPKEEKIFKEEYINIVVEDLGLQTGDISFKMSTNAIKKQPGLKLW